MKVKARRRNSQRGVSLIEILLVVFILLIAASVASPVLYSAVYNMRLRGAAADLAGLMQQARIQAARKNTAYGIAYTTVGSSRIAYIDLNGNGAWDGGTNPEPLVEFTGTVATASAAPNGTSGQPSAYVLAGDSSTGTVNTNANKLAFSSRGLPCNYDSAPTCSTPSASYFVYYLTDTRVGSPGWAAVVVTKSGRTKVVMWNGSSWQ